MVAVFQANSLCPPPLRVMHYDVFAINVITDNRHQNMNVAILTANPAGMLWGPEHVVYTCTFASHVCLGGEYIFL